MIYRILIIFTSLFLCFPSYAQDKLDTSTLVSCKFKELVDGSYYFVFGLTESKSQVIQTFTEDTYVAAAGNIFIYDYIGISDAKIYKIYKSGKVVLGVHRTKPAIFYVLESNEPIVGYCNKLLQ